MNFIQGGSKVTGALGAPHRRLSGLSSHNRDIAQNIRFELDLAQTMIEDVSDADQADKLAMLDNRKVANTSMRHEPGNVHDCIGWRACDDPRRHQVGNSHVDQCVPVSRETMRDIAL